MTPVPDAVAVSTQDESVGASVRVEGWSVAGFTFNVQGELGHKSFRRVE